MGHRSQKRVVVRLISRYGVVDGLIFVNGVQPGGGEEIAPPRNGFEAWTAFFKKKRAARS